MNKELEVKNTPINLMDHSGYNKQRSLFLCGYTIELPDKLYTTKIALPYQGYKPAFRNQMSSRWCLFCLINLPSNSQSLMNEVFNEMHLRNLIHSLTRNYGLRIQIHHLCLSFFGTVSAIIMWQPYFSGDGFIVRTDHQILTLELLLKS